MALNVTLQGMGAFSATVDQSEYTFTVEIQPSTFTLNAEIATPGPKGDKGEKGDTGATGPQGPAGTAATIAVGTTTTLSAGSAATVANVGTSGAAVFNFGIPQGIQGIKGDKGDTGNTGTAATVAAGTTTTGSPGTNASVTNSGTSLAAVFDFTIPRGDKGDKGDKGDTGATGATGVVAATAPIQYDSETQTVSIDPEYKPNPFDQSLNTTDTPQFAGLLITDGISSGQFQQPSRFVLSGSSVLDAGLVVDDANGSLTIVSPYGITFPDTTSQTTAFIPANYTPTSGLGTAAFASTSDFYSSTNPSGYITSSALTGYATETWVGSQGYLLASTAASTYQTQAGMSAYLTTASAASTYLTQTSAASTYLTQTNAASTYQTQAGMSAYAALSSPTFTGDPKAPTPATSDNDTSIATTAFVNSYCPAASTSAAGKVQLATEAQSQAKTSTTTAITPAGLLNSAVGWCSIGSANVGTSTSVGTVLTGAYGSVVRLTATATGQYAIVFPSTGNVNVLTTTGTLYDRSDFSKRIKLYGRCYTLGISNNASLYYSYKVGGGTSGDIAARGVGIRITSSNVVELQVHDGTTLTNVSSSFSVTGSIVFDCLIDSLGDGTVNLYINGSLVATTNAGPKTTSALVSWPNVYQEIWSSGVTTATNWYVEAKAIYLG